MSQKITPLASPGNKKATGGTIKIHLLPNPHRAGNSHNLQVIPLQGQAATGTIITRRRRISHNRAATSNPRETSPPCRKAMNPCNPEGATIKLCLLHRSRNKAQGSHNNSLISSLLSYKAMHLHSPGKQAGISINSLLL